MGRITFTSENKVEDSSNFPKLKLDDGEYARILCFEDPDYAYVHTLRAPKMVSGVVQFRTQKGRDGSDFQVMEKDFISNPICLGDEGTLQDKGVDPANCPVCKLAVESDMVDPPKRRFAMHVFQYNTSGTKKPTKQFGGQVKIWAFTDFLFNKLVDIVEENDSLQKVDLILGPCTNKQFQKYEIMASTQTVWTTSDETKAFVKEAIAEQRAKDLQYFCGRKTERKWIEDDLNKVRSKYRTANGLQGESANDSLVGAETPSLSEGLGSLLDKANSDEPKVVKSFDDFEATSSESVEVSNSSEDPEDWDSLLKSLND